MPFVGDSLLLAAGNFLAVADHASSLGLKSDEFLDSL